MNVKPGFFIPFISQQKTEVLYQQIRRRLSCPSYLLTDRRIFKLVLEHQGKIKVGQTKIEVGKGIYEGGDFVLAIFETAGWYLVCTKTRGGFTGTPLYVDGQDVVRVIDF